MVLSGGSSVKSLPDNAGDTGSIPGTGRSPGGGNGNPLQYPCLGSPMDREAWQATVSGSQRVRHDLATKQQQTRLMSTPGENPIIGQTDSAFSTEPLVWIENSTLL